MVSFITWTLRRQRLVDNSKWEVAVTWLSMWGNCIRHHALRPLQTLTCYNNSDVSVQTQNSEVLCRVQAIANQFSLSFFICPVNFNGNNNVNWDYLNSKETVQLLLLSGYKSLVGLKGLQNVKICKMCLQIWI